MSALGQKQTFRRASRMSALPSIADILRSDDPKANPSVKSQCSVTLPNNLPGHPSVEHVANEPKHSPRKHA
jgi:hypothetical protein